MKSEDIVFLVVMLALVGAFSGGGYLMYRAYIRHEKNCRGC
jgi:hypothetical protein